MIIRIADDSDLPGLLEIEEQCFGVEKFSSETVRSFMHRDDSFVLLALSDESSPLGSAMCFLSRDRREGRIASIAVLPGWRRRGIGRSLLEKCESELRRRNLRKFTLEVDTTNEAALALYSSEGYQIIGTIEHFYGPGRHAYSMEKREIHSC